MNEIALIRQNLGDERIAGMSGESLMGSLARMVPTLFVLAGQQCVKENVEVMCRELAKDLRERYGTLTVREVEYALRSGVKGYYGEYFGINAVSANRWLRAYRDSEERRIAVAERRAAMEEHDVGLLPQRTEPTAEERERMFRERYNKLAEDFRREGYCADLGNCVYNELDRRGLIRFTGEKKREFVERARRELISRMNEERGRGGNVRLVVLVNALRREWEEMGGDARNRVVARAKVLALNEYFGRLKGEGKLLEI